MKSIVILVLVSLSLPLWGDGYFSSSTNGTQSVTVDRGTHRLVNPSAAELVAANPVLAPPEYRNATFVLPMDCLWTDYELKASIDNFTSEPVYWFDSAAGTVLPTIGTSAPGAWFIQTLPVPGISPRAWVPQVKEFSISSQMRAATSPSGDDRRAAISGVVIQVRGEGAWCSSTNASLIWSYRRKNASAYEAYQNSTTPGYGAADPVWRPVLPTQWNNTLLSP
jgi:hypothetical protein